MVLESRNRVGLRKGGSQYFTSLNIHCFDWKTDHREAKYVIGDINIKPISTQTSLDTQMFHIRIENFFPMC